MTRRIISTILAFVMILSVLLSAVSCNELFDELLADPNEAQSDIERETDDVETPEEKTTKEEKTEKKTLPHENEITEEETTHPIEHPTKPEETTKPETHTKPAVTKPVETEPVEHPTKPVVTKPVETEPVEPETSGEETSYFECSHCDCIMLGCHYCEFCGKKLSDCADYDGDHMCDGCGKTLSKCVDYNNDHFCDECGRKISSCTDYDDHKCDECGKTLSECADYDNDGVCDVCGVLVGYPGLSGAAGMHAPDTYRENGVIMKDGEADRWIRENRADGISGVDNIGFRGWAFIGDGKTVGIADFGYGFKQVEGITWGFEPIVDEMLYAPLEGRTETRRYEITIDLTGLETGEYDVILYIKDTNGNIYVMDRWVDIWVNIEATAAPDTPVEPEIPDASIIETITIPEAIALGSSMEHNTYTDKYYVKGTIKEIVNDRYGNMYIADEAGNQLYVYGSYNADGSVRFDAMDVKPMVGDKITIFGVIGQYNGNVQMKNAWIVGIYHEHTCEETAPCVPKTCMYCGETYEEPLEHKIENGMCIYCDAVIFLITNKYTYVVGERVEVTAGCDEKAYVRIYVSGTTELIDYYIVGEGNGFENLAEGTYDIVLDDYLIPNCRYKTVTITIVAA